MDDRRTVLRSRSRMPRAAHGFGASRMALRALAVGLLGIVLTSFGLMSGCSRNVATGEEHINLVSESQEIAMGQQADSQVVATMGLYPDQNLQSWIQRFGETLAKSSERPNLPWTFRVVDDPVVNAFALPGGFIYVTRGLMTHVGNEAELAGVVGHEIGHVTAQHSVHRMSSSQLTQLGVIAGMAIEPRLQQYQQLIGAGLGLLFLKFSRDDEKQADDLGLRYMSRSNFDPMQMPKVFQMLDRVSKAEGGGGTPEWLQTHPNPGNREARMKKALDSMGVKNRQGTIGTNEYLALIDGMTYGQNPREGFFRNGIFYQPEMKFQFQFPSGWQTANQSNAVVGVSSNQDAVLQVTLAQGASSDQAANAFVNQQGLQATQPKQGNLNGMPAVTSEFRATTDQGTLHGVATWVDLGGNTYQIIGYTTDQLFGRYSSTFGNSMQSFSRLTDPALLNVQPMRVKVVRVNQAATLGQLARQYDSPVPVEQLAVINQVDNTFRFSSGESVKLVVGSKSDANVLAR